LFLDQYQYLLISLAFLQGLGVLCEISFPIKARQKGVCRFQLKKLKIFSKRLMLFSLFRPIYSGGIYVYKQIIQKQCFYNSVQQPGLAQGIILRPGRRNPAVRCSDFHQYTGKCAVYGF